jgi:hypothetical protein
MRTFIIAAFIVIANTSFAVVTDSITTNKNTNDTLKLQVLYFHITNRCHTCLSIETEIRKTLLENYKGRIDSGMIRFASINVEDSVYFWLANKYETGGASLFLTKYTKGKEGQKEDMTSWAFEKIHATDIFDKELEEKINEFLK